MEGGTTRYWQYDEAGSLLAPNGEAFLHNRPVRSGDATCEYDGYGRLKTRRYPEGRREHFGYNTGHQLVQVTFSGHPTLTQARYGYDIAGRRTHKTLTHHGGRQETTTFLWCGLRLYGESASHTPDTTLLYFYNEDSHEPLARAVKLNGEYRLHWYHTQLNGLPEALTDQAGRVVWHGQYDEWGVYF